MSESKTTIDSGDIEVQTKKERDGVWIFGRIGDTPFRAKYANALDKKALMRENITYLLARPNLFRCNDQYQSGDAVFANGAWISYPESDADRAAIEDLLERLRPIAQKQTQG
ncbi:MAG: hypothetical protein LBG83_04965 [Oscillospiraceae bacterium]|nr:hypothetical protein [Oscillospiraceae bacterium]